MKWLTFLDMVKQSDLHVAWLYKPRRFAFEFYKVVMVHLLSMLKCRFQIIDNGFVTNTFLKLNNW